jgi:uncharacterized membrane protein
LEIVKSNKMANTKVTNNEVPDPLAHWVHRSLLAGLIVSAAALIVGVAVAIAKDQPLGEGGPPKHVRALVEDAAHGNGDALLNLGILALLFTPICRVVVLAIGWTVRREHRMAFVALCVLALLAISLIVGIG